MDAARELAQLVERGGELLACGFEHGVGGGRIGVELALGEAERERERDEPLLRAVVEVALEPAPGLVARLDDAGARRAQLLLLPLPVADVREQRQVADHVLGRVPDRRRRDLDVDQVPVLAEALPFDAGVDLAGADARHQLREPFALLFRDVPERAADHLLRRPAEHPLGGGIPHRDPVVEVDLEHRHRRGLDRRPQALLARAQVVLAALPIGHVDAADEHALAPEDVDDRRRGPLDDPLRHPPG